MILNNPDLKSVIDDTAKFFGAETPLRKAAELGGRTYEERPQQQDMAISVAESLASSENLCIEAPTGVGKSIAYLVPSIYYALATEKPVIITTETINLQEQLIDKDIPLIKKLFNREFKACLAMGRSNYLCRRRLDLIMSGHSNEYIPSDSLVEDINLIIHWAKSTTSGTKSDMKYEPKIYAWQCVCSETNTCTGDKCKYSNNCFYTNACKSMAQANVIVANHAMFFSDLKMKMQGFSGIFPQYSAVIIDESHHLEDTAAKHLGAEISDKSIYDMLNRLFNPARSRGLLTRAGLETLDLRDFIALTYDHVKTFFNSYKLLIKKGDSSDKRIKETNFVKDTLTEKLDSLERKLGVYINLQKDEDFKTELNAQMLLCKEFRKTLIEAFTVPNDDSVYWVEIGKKAKKTTVAINYAPLNVAQLLRKHLFNSGIPVVLTSATLSVNKDLDYYTKRVGFTGSRKVLSSPFDYKAQVKVYIPEMITNPSNKDIDADLAKYIKKYIELTKGKAFVLFTSYKKLLKVKALTEEFFNEKGIKLIVQGDGLNRSKMVELFKQDITSVLFGTDSFWQGVDVPGEALSNVIITKLPFSVFTEPITEARCEKIENEGGNSFYDYILPQAVLKFKQGIGRLIRSKTDTGILVILDNRVLSRTYGRVFLDSIPECQRIIE